ncbi:right-handed parallel beta-helix repeat-containing protein [Chitinophagaceae bacterium LB-8]|uniref:Right-handed parallel beta-helix repeat-containing protein n=1 Tax=Paraflavisolibacter caeni TaxID=2982496 RepID=A0A9X3BI94_9BACT|nr:right-handed parallel beta-helix repeat-containing protein [Paraflavisolibacter caeni]MCU7549788.1 right-handed parallel beta-helix repeat-containing protein [Paraflavisolibacter caeni]
MTRRSWSVIFYFLVIFFGLSVNAFGINIYISPSGKDSNKGSKQSPLLTLNGARDRIRELRKSGPIKETIYVIIENGVYYMSRPLELSSEDGGSAAAPVVYKAADGASPVFYGGIEIRGFTKVNDQLWKAFVPQTANFGWYFEQLFVNDKRAQRAVSPDTGFYYLKSADETILDKRGANAGFAVQQVWLDSVDAAKELSLVETKEWNDVIFHFYHKWDYTRKRLQFYNPENSSFYVEGKSMKPWNRLDSHTLVAIENYRQALDHPGEWFLSRSGELFYIPLPGETIEHTRFMAPVLDRFIVMQGNEQTGKQVEYIRFENLRFKVSRYQTGAGGIEPMQAGAQVDAVILADFASNISFMNCEVGQIGTYAFWFRKSCSNCTVQHCLMQDLGAGGIKIGNVISPQKGVPVYSDTLKTDPIDSIAFQKYLTRKIKIDNNIIRGGGKIFPCAVGVGILNGSDNTVSHNEISDLFYSGISVGWVWGYSYSAAKRNTISFNHIHHLGWGVLSDMGGIYTLGPSEGTVVSNNTVHDIYAYSYGGWGLYTDEGSSGILMENNLVYNCKSQGFHQHYGRNNIIRNNIFAFNGKSQLAATRIEKHLSFSFTNNIIYFTKGELTAGNWHKVNILSDSNCYWDTRTPHIKFDTISFDKWQNLGRDQHSVITDPMFVAPESYNFGIKNSALCRTIGFKPFDYGQAGVYGSAEWKQKAALQPGRMKQFSIEHFPENRTGRD